MKIVEKIVEKIVYRDRPVPVVTQPVPEPVEEEMIEQFPVMEEETEVHGWDSQDNKNI